MIKSKHLSVLEHGTAYLAIPWDEEDDVALELRKLWKNPYTVSTLGDKIHYITTNYRVIYENKLQKVLKYLCEPTEFHEKRITVKFTSNIHFYKDLTRHRKMSFAIESTNYCNYCKDRFGEEITYIIPVWLDLPEGGAYWHDGIGWRVGTTEENNHLGESVKPNDRWDLDTCRVISYFLNSLHRAEESYMLLIKSGWKARQAAEVLPQSTKADIIVTGFVSDYQHIFNLRTSIIAETGQPHPELARLMDPLYEEFKDRKLIV